MLIHFRVSTQYRENYGTAEEPFWKFKGGEDYLFSTDIKGNEFLSKKLESVVWDILAPYIEYHNDYSSEEIIDWDIVEPHYQTDFEKSQLEMDGEILYPAKRYDVDEFIKQQRKAA